MTQSTIISDPAGTIDCGLTTSRYPEKPTAGPIIDGMINHLRQKQVS